MPLSAASAAAASSLSSFSRFFRHDNHLLWFAVIAVVGVTIYLVMSYNTTKTHEQTEIALQRVRSSSGMAPHTYDEEEEENTDAVGDGGDGDREGYSNAPQRDDHLSTSSASSSTSPTSPSRRVRFKTPTAEDETTYSTDAPPSAVRASSASRPTFFLGVKRTSLFEAPQGAAASAGYRSNASPGSIATRAGGESPPRAPEAGRRARPRRARDRARAS